MVVAFSIVIPQTLFKCGCRFLARFAKKSMISCEKELNLCLGLDLPRNQLYRVRKN